MTNSKQLMKNSTNSLLPRVKAVWRREQTVRLIEGALAFVRWGLALFLAAGFTDWMIGRWLTDLPAVGRSVLLLVVLGVPLYKAWCAGWKYVRPFNATRTALRIEEQKGGMESLLVTGLQLGDTARRHGTSDALCDLTCRKAEESAVGIRPKDAVRLDSLRRPAVRTLVVSLLFLLVAATHGPLVVAGLGRIFAPWLAITYPTRTRLELAKTDLVVQEGKPVRIAASMAGVVPRKAKIALRTGKGKPRVRKLPVSDGTCEYLIETAYRGFEYRWTAGDARSKWCRVEVIPAPNIERAELRLEFPEYTRRPVQQVGALTVTVPESTRIQWTLLLDRPVREATMALADEDPVALAISKDGLTVEAERMATESRAYGFSWVEREHGFVFTSPNNYLQVSPDRPPRVELTSPDRNLYATLGRKLDLVFRGRDDHGIGESFVCYRIDKNKEKKIPFTPLKPIDGTEQTIDWDYRTVLTKLKVGQTVTFAVELADRYPGKDGPHRVRSEARRMQFLSMENYLAQIEERQKKLLTRLRTLYREERKVHEVVLRLDRSDPVFVQSCQLEAVRQDMTRDRVNDLAGEMLHMTEDLAANSVTNESVTAILVQLRADLMRISAEHVAEAANALRALASESGGPGGDHRAAKAHAVHMVNSSARELGLLVMHLGFEDAAEVMASEMHAAALTEAALRLQTILSGADADRLAGDQERLGKWLARLFVASPKGKESTVTDALIEFTLTRLAKRLINDGIDAQLQNAAGLIREGKSAEAAKIQSGVIGALLAAEFKLLVGSEREAVARAKSLFVSQQKKQDALRREIESLDAKAFKQRRGELVDRQEALHRKLQMLLMPAVPARRARLFDDVYPSAPAAADLLVAADDGMTKAASHIKAGERDAAGKVQQEAQDAFVSLVDIAEERIAVMTRPSRIQRQSYNAIEDDRRLGLLAERQLALQEKTADAAAAGAASAYLADREAFLADAVDDVHRLITERIRSAQVPSEFSLEVPARIADAVQSMRKAVPLLKDNKPRKAREHQKAAVVALSGAQGLIKEHGATVGAYVGMVGMTMSIEGPSPYVGEIKEEQRDLLAVTRQTKTDDLPALAIAQKNLIHAVNAMINVMDAVVHLLADSPTQMLFAKTDMDQAGIALDEKDEDEALDAQDYIVESLTDLQVKAENLVPQCRYLLEIVRALYEAVPEGISIREAQRRLRERASAATGDAAALGKEQAALRLREEAYGKLINEIMGPGFLVGSAAHMAEAEDRLKAADRAAAARAMATAEKALKDDTETVLKMMKQLTLVLSNPPWPGWEVTKEWALCRDVLVMAAPQKHVCRESYAAKPDAAKDHEPKLREFAEACDPFIRIAKMHENPKPKGWKPTDPLPPSNLHLKLVAAKGYLDKAAESAKASDRAKALASQKDACEVLRHFICEYAFKFCASGGGGESETPSDAFNEKEDPLAVFAKGVLLGRRPKDGKIEGGVLGKRDRAALNENFARELPLEYRAILKDYYERLAE